MAKPVKVSNVETFWASLSERNSMSNKYQVDLSKLNERQVAGLEALGVEVKNKGDDREYFVTCKSEYPIDVYDSEGNKLRGNEVGNGSVADAVISTYEWSFKNKKGVALNVLKLVVTDLNHYESEVDMNDVEEL
jgi:hypothetical protein